MTFSNSLLPTLCIIVIGICIILLARRLYRPHIPRQIAHPGQLPNTWRFHAKLGQSVIAKPNRTLSAPMTAKQKGKLPECLNGDTPRERQANEKAARPPPLTIR